MIEICNRQNRIVFDEKLEDMIRFSLESALKKFQVSRPVVSLAIVDDESIHALNKQYRHIDRPTDVLSFAAREGMQMGNPSGREFLGDIIISLETAQRQAGEYGHSLQREVVFLAVHGLLHLLGYDHMESEEEKEMFSLQEEILQELGITR